MEGTTAAFCCGATETGATHAGDGHVLTGDDVGRVIGVARTSAGGAPARHDLRRRSQVGAAAAGTRPRAITHLRGALAFLTASLLAVHLTVTVPNRGRCS
jgi:hypothetical protein